MQHDAESVVAVCLFVMCLEEIVGEHFLGQAAA
jgi:hypothetical protein